MVERISDKIYFNESEQADLKLPAVLNPLAAVYRALGLKREAVSLSSRAADLFQSPIRSSKYEANAMNMHAGRMLHVADKVLNELCLDEYWQYTEQSNPNG